MPSVVVRTYLGIDPGASGGIAVIRGRKIEAVPIPETEKDTWEWISRWSEPFGEMPYAAIERVQGFIGEGQPGSAMFKFGRSYGFLRACLVAARIPFHDPTPQAWQKGIAIVPRKSRDGETKPQFKKRLKSMAQQLYPEASVTLATADAILIAHWCKMKEECRL